MPCSGASTCADRRSSRSPRSRVPSRVRPQLWARRRRLPEVPDLRRGLQAPRRIGGDVDATRGSPFRPNVRAARVYDPPRLRVQGRPSSPTVATEGLDLEGVPSRGDRTGTCTPRFWRPVLYQIELRPWAPSIVDTRFDDFDAFAEE